MIKVRENLEGKVFGQITVVCRAPDYISPKGAKSNQWLCKNLNNEYEIFLGNELKNKGVKLIIKHPLSNEEINKVLAFNKNYKEDLQIDQENKHIRKIESKQKRDNHKDLLIVPENLIGKNQYIKQNLVRYLIGLDKNNNYFIIDKEDFDKVKDFYWEKNESGYFTSNFEGQKIYLHWLIIGIYEEFGFIINEDVKKEIEKKYNRKGNTALVDHVNRKPWDCRLINLRFTNSSLNKQNISVYGNNISGIIGVSKNHKTGQWRADITINRKRKYLGGYNEKIEAIKSRLLGEMIWFENGYEPQRELFERFNIYRWYNIEGIGMVDLKEWGRNKENEKIIFNVGRY